MFLANNVLQMLKSIRRKSKIIFIIRLKASCIFSVFSRVFFTSFYLRSAFKIFYILVNGKFNVKEIFNSNVSVVEFELLLLMTVS